MTKFFILIVLLASANVSAQNINRKQLLSDIEILSSDVYEGRKTATRENQMAANYIVDRFKAIGLNFYQDSFKHPFTFQNRSKQSVNGTNLIGYVKGRSDDVIIISAHYDHVGISNSLIYNGADDNASGVAGLLAMATYFEKHKPKNSMIFISFDAEEMGLQGAYAYLKNPIIEGARIKLMVNLDMISRSEKGELYAVGAFKNPVLKKILKDADEKTGIKMVFGHDDPKLGRDDWTMQSDQGPFAQNNIPFVYFGVEDHKDYHKPTDEYENINPDFFYSASNVILNSILKLDKQLKTVTKNSKPSAKKALSDKVAFQEN